MYALRIFLAIDCAVIVTRSHSSCYAFVFLILVEKVLSCNSASRLMHVITISMDVFKERSVIVKSLRSTQQVLNSS
jgi:hypothetical protein